MANTALIKRSSVANKVPTTSDLSLGELAVNTYDGKLFLKKSVGGTESIVDLTNADKLDGQDGSYYTSYTDTAIANLIDSSPDALNTLNELSAALNDDASFSTTITNSIATKLPLAGGTLTGNLKIVSDTLKLFLGASEEMQVFHDGTSSLIKDTRNNGKVRIQADNFDFIDKDASGVILSATSSGLNITGTCTATTFSGSGASLTNIPAAQLTGVLPAIDGSNLTGIVASGQNANTLDNLDSTQFLRSDANDTTSGKLHLTYTNTYPLDINGSDDGKIVLQGSSNPYIRFREGTSDKAYMQWSSNGNFYIVNQYTGEHIYIGTGSTGLRFVHDGTTSTVWHSGNDGSGSGLDSDTLDGFGSGQFVRSDVTDIVSGATKFSSIGLQLSGHWYNAYYDAANAQNYIHFYPAITSDRGTTASTTDIRAWTGSTFKVLQIKGDSNDITWGGSKLWTAANDGSGSGLDSDTVDGLQASSFLRSDAEDTITAPLVVNAGTANAANDATLYITASNNNDWGIKLNNYNSSATEYGARIEVGSSANYALQIVGGGSEVFRVTGAGTVYAGGNGVVFHTNNDGSGSGLDSDTVDGIQASSFLRSDADDTTSGQITISRNNSSKMVLNGNDDSRIYFQENTVERGYIGWDSGEDGYWIWNNQLSRGFLLNAIPKWYNGSGYGTLWHSLNDGSGSGLDSDFLDGQNGSYYRNAGNLNAGSISADRIANGSITNAKLATGIDGDKILNLTIDSTELENNCIITDKITNSAVTNAKISSMDASKLTGTVAAARLGTSSTSEHGVSAVGNFGQYENHGTYSDFNTEPAFWGWNYVTGNTNAPNTSSSQWYRCRVSLGSSYGKGSASGDYSLELAIPRSSPSSAGGLHLRTIENGGEGSWHEVASKVGNATVFHQNNDGSGSGLDSDTLDGVQGGNFLRNDTDNGVSNHDVQVRFYSDVSIHTTSAYQAALEVYQSSAGNDAFMAFHVAGDYAAYFGLDGNINDFAVGGWSMGNNRYRIWHQGNDGSGSGLDSDTLRGWSGFPAGTLMLFHQTSAPTGWTKSTSHNNKALRVVTGTVGSGGSTTFANAFNANRVTTGGSVSNHTLSTAQMPSHTHTGKAPNHDTNSANSQGYPYGDNHQSHRTSDRGRNRNMASASHANTGSSNSHNHGFSNPSFNLNVQYVDVIIASKN